MNNSVDYAAVNSLLDMLLQKGTFSKTDVEKKEVVDEIVNKLDEKDSE